MSMLLVDKTLGKAAPALPLHVPAGWGAAVHPRGAGLQDESTNTPVLPSECTFSEHAPPDIPEAESQGPAGERQSHSPGHGCNQPGEKRCQGLPPGSCGTAASPAQPSGHTGDRLPWDRTLWQGAGRQGGPQGDPAPAFSPCAGTPSPLLAQKMPLKQLQPLDTASQGVCPPARAVVLLGSPRLVQPGCSTGPSPGPTAALLSCSGLGAGPCPPTCSLCWSHNSLGVLGLQGHQKQEEEEAAEDHGPPRSHYDAAAAEMLPAAGAGQYVTAHHSLSQLVTAHHSLSQLVTAHHSSSQLVTVCHSLSQLITALHSLSQNVTVSSQFVTARHSSSQQGCDLTTPSGHTLRQAPQPTPVAREILNLHMIARPCSTRAWNEQKWRNMDLFWEAALPWKCTGTQILLPRNQSPKAPYED